MAKQEAAQWLQSVCSDSKQTLLCTYEFCRHLAAPKTMSTTNRALQSITTSCSVHAQYL